MIRYLALLPILAALLIYSLSVNSARATEITPQNSFYLSVEDARGDSGWAAGQCAILHNDLTLARHAPANTQCGSLGDASAIEAARQSGRFSYHYTASRRTDGSIALGVHDWTGVGDDTEPRDRGWTVGADTEDGQRTSVQKLVEHSVRYDQTRRMAKELMLLGGLKDSKRVALDGSGEYRNTATRQRVSFDDAYKIYQDEDPRHRHFLRAGLEIMAIFGAGMSWYWADAKFNSPDWDLNWDWASWRKKTYGGGGIAFDTNGFNTNATFHPLAGTLYYLFARTNNLNPLESFLFAVAGSTIWEYVAEFKEKVSINDLIVTPIAGMAIGEVFAQLGAFFDRGEDNLVNTTLSSIFASPRKFNNWAGKNTPRHSGGYDRLGFTREIFHQFSLWAAGGVGTNVDGHGGSTDMIQIGLETHIVTIPGYGQAGHVSRVLTDGNFTKLMVKATFGQDGMMDFLFLTKAALAGYYKQSIEKGDNGNLKGYSFYVGAATQFEYNLAHRPTGAPDTVAVINVLGPTMDLTYYKNGLKVNATIDVFPNFALVRSYALDKYTDAGGSLAGAKSVLAEQRYYYAFGITVDPRVTASYHGFEVGAELKFQYFNSIDGGDRHPERITGDFNLTDQRASYRAWASYTLPSDHLKLEFSVEHKHSEGELQGVEDSHDENRYMGSMILLF